MNSYEARIEVGHRPGILDPQGGVIERALPALGYGNVSHVRVGKSIRLAVVDVTLGKNPEAKIVLVNPEIIHAEGEVREEEGCLSVPGFRGYVVRPQFVTVRAQNAKGETFEIRGENLLARAFCHEIDHLHGILFLTHLSMLKRDLIKRKIKKLRKEGEW